MGLSPDVKERLSVVFEVAKTAFHWGFIPTVIYLGNSIEKGIHFYSYITTKLFNLFNEFAGFRKGAEGGHPPLTIFR